MVKEYIEGRRATPIASTTSTRTPRPRIDTSIGDAVSRLGQSLGSLEDRQDAYDTERAVGAYKLEQARLLDEYSRDPTPTSAKTAKDQFRRLREKQQRGMRNDSGKQLFKDSTNAIDGLAFNALAENTFRKEKDIAIASLDNTTVDSLRLATGKSTAEKEAFQEMNSASIANNVRSGYMTVTEGERRIRASREEFANQAVNEMPNDDVTDKLTVNGDDGETSTIEIIKRVGGKDGDLLTKIAMLESGLDTNADNKTSKGLFQFEDDQLKDYYDPVESTELASKMLNNNRTALKTALGREATEGELYLAHQQGVTGTGHLLLEPKALAVDVLTESYESRAKAENAILKNGGSLDMTSSEFTGMWTERMDNVKVKDTISYMYEKTGSLTDYASSSVRAAKIKLSKKERLSNLSQEMADTVNALPIAERMKHVSGIKDTKMRSAVNKLVREQITIENSISTAKENDFEQRAISASQGTHKDDEGTFITLSRFKAENPMEWESMPKTKRDILEDSYDRTLRQVGISDIKSANNMHLYRKEVANNSDVWQDINWVAASKQLNTADFKRLHKGFEDYKQGNMEFVTSSKTQTRIVNSMIESSGVKNKKGKARLTGSFYDAVDARELEIGRELTTKEYKEVSKDLLREVVLEDETLWFDEDTSVAKLLAQKITDIDDIPEKYRSSTYVLLQDRGIKRPTDEQILEAYKPALMGGDI